MLLRTLAEGGKILACGNGGSAAQASHLVGELTIRFINDRRALAAVSLASDAVALTAAGNDYGFERVFSRQVEALGQPGDCLIAFSTSGHSKNVNEALAMASRIGMRTLGVSGRKGFTAHCDVDLIVPSSSTARRVGSRRGRSLFSGMRATSAASTSAALRAQCASVLKI
jgi:D-sedoheptulose 7-phosphate isomerase